MRVRDLSLELGISLRQTFGDDVIDEAVAVLQLMTRQLATETNRRRILVLGNGANHQVDFFVVEGRVGH